MSILKVKASGTVKKRPDIINLSFTITEEDKNYEKTLKKGCDLTALFICALSEFNIQKEDIRTNGFNVREIYKKIENKKETKREIDGYMFTQHLTAEIDFDLAILGKLLESVSQMKNPPRTNISFGLKDMETAKTEALELAFLKCKEKAEILAKISGKQIKDCIELNYDVPSNYRSYANCVCDEESVKYMSSNNLDLSTSIIPDDIEVSEYIITIWEI